MPKYKLKIGDKVKAEIEKGDNTYHLNIEYLGLISDSVVLNLKYTIGRKYIRDDSGDEDIIFTHKLNNTVFLPYDPLNVESIVGDIVFKCTRLGYGMISLSIEHEDAYAIT